MRILNHSLCLLLILAFYVQISIANVAVWIGQSGQWDNPTNWLNDQLPDASSTVHINGNYSDVITISSNITIQGLTFDGGILSLHSNSSLTISQETVLLQGSMECLQLRYNQFIYSSLNLYGNTTVTGSFRKHFKYLHIHQYDGIMNYHQGDMVLTNSTFHLHQAATFLISPNTNSRDIRFIKSDESRSHFNLYPNKVLNTDVNLIYQLPPPTAVFDLLIDNAEHIISTPSNNSNGMFAVSMEKDRTGAAYYAYHTTHLPWGDREALYNRTIQHLDEDQCAQICITLYASWCKSFDFFANNQSCYLSKHRANAVGGLTAIPAIHPNITYPIDHYAFRPTSREVDSYLILEGKVDMNCSSCHVLNSLQTTLYHTLHLTAGANLTFHKTLTLAASATIVLEELTTFTMSGTNASLIMQSTASIHSTAAYSSPSLASTLSFINGNHQVYGNITGGIILVLDDYAMVTMGQYNMTHQSDAWEHNSRRIQAIEWSITHSSVLSITTSQLFLVLDSLSVTEHSSLIVAYAECNITHQVMVDNTSMITATGQGYPGNAGLAAGTSFATGGSGGSYGGRGSAAKVDAIGMPYGSVLYPMQAGSGGGTGYYPHSAGAGGGVIMITTNFTHIDGTISSNGGDGNAGGGGGSGGSVWIITKSFSGTGMISAAGGNGGFAGGLISGGGGSGGRIAINTIEFTFNGKYTVIGGYFQPTYDRKTNEQAGAGTIYLLSSAFEALITADQVLSGCLSQLQARQSLVTTSSRLDTDYNTKSLRGAYVLDDLHTYCDLDYYVVGNVPLYFYGSHYCIKHIIGSGNNPHVYFHPNSQIVYPTSTWVIDTVAVHLQNSSFVYPFNHSISVINTGKIYLYTQSITSHSTVIQLNSLNIAHGGSLYLPNTTEILTNKLTLSSNSQVFIAQTLNITGNNMTIHQTTMTSLDVDTHRAQLNYSSLYISASTHVVLTNEWYISGIDVTFAGMMSIPTNQALITIPPSLGKTDVNAYPTFHMMEGSTVDITGTLTVLQMIMHVYSDVQWNILGKLIFEYCKSVAYPYSVWSTSLTASILFVNTTMDILDDANFNGLGTIIISNSSQVLLPSYLPLTTAAITLDNYGTLICDHSLHSVTSFYQSTLSCNVTSSIIVNSHGQILIDHAAALFTHQYAMNGGELQLFHNASSWTIASSNHYIHDGMFSGAINGSIIIPAAFAFTLQPTSSAQLISLKQVKLYNYGTLIAQKNTISWIHHSVLFNYGIVDFQDTQNWLFEDSLSGFALVEPQIVSSSDTTTSIDETAVTEGDEFDFTYVYSIPTLSNCAYTCIHYQTTYATVDHIAAYQVAMDAHEYYSNLASAESYPCQAFLYHAKLQTCKLIMMPIVLDINNVLRSQKDWFMYNKINDWVIPSKIVNTRQGLIRLASGKAVQMDIGLSNYGTIQTPATSALLITGTLHQYSSGSMNIQGNVTVSKATSIQISPLDYQRNFISGSLFGPGHFRLCSQSSYMAASSSSPSEITSPSSISNILSNYHHVLFTTNISDPALQLSIVTTSVMISNITTLHSKILTIDHSNVYIANTSLSIMVTQSILLYNQSRLYTNTDTLVPSDIQCHTYTNCFDLNITAPSVHAYSSSQIQVVSGIFHVTNFYVHTTASVSCDGTGYSHNHTSGVVDSLSGKYHFLGSSGGTHAGLGGHGYTTIVPNTPTITYSTLNALPIIDVFANDEVIYGNFYDTNTWGLPGGKGFHESNYDRNGNSPRGGGKMSITSKQLVVDGTLTCNGMTLSNSLAGGGAGGSIRIETSTLSGTGMIQSKGGDGGRTSRGNALFQGGGGGGGRIALYYHAAYTFPAHRFLALGGNGYQQGSAGTIYLHNTTAGSGELHIRSFPTHEESNTALYTILSEQNRYGPLVELRIENTSQVMIRRHGEVFSTQKVIGDGSTKLLITNGTIFTAAYSLLSDTVPSIHNHTLIFENIDVVLLNAALNTSNIIIEPTTTLHLTPFGMSSPDFPIVPSMTSPPTQAIYSFVNLMVFGTLIIDYLPNRLPLPLYTIPPIVLNITHRMYIAPTGTLHTNGKGYSSSMDVTNCSVLVHGLGCSNLGKGMGGGGGSYGGKGGDGFGVETVGNVYDTFPTYGSGGGGAYPGVTGGHGGGIMYIVGDTIVLNGTISADGEQATGAGAGGGSGGSVYISVQNILGHGQITANGGNGYYSDTYFGGGGSGGRIQIHCTHCVTSTTNTTQDDPYTFQITAFGGLVHHINTPQGFEQIPIWNAFGTSSTNWLRTKPACASAGMIYLPDVDRLIIKNVPKQTIHVHTCHIVNGHKACATIPYQLSNGVSELYYPFFMVKDLVLMHNNMLIPVNSVLNITNHLHGNNESMLMVDGMLLLPDRYTLTHMSIQLHGVLIGAYEFTVALGAQFTLSPTSFWESHSVFTTYGQGSFEYARYLLTNELPYFVSSMNTNSSTNTTSPVIPTHEPTEAPTEAPTETPTFFPTDEPTESPSISLHPTRSSTFRPTTPYIPFLRSENIYDAANLTLSMFNLSSLVLQNSSSFILLGGNTFAQHRIILQIHTLHIDATSSMSADGQGYESRGRVFSGDQDNVPPHSPEASGNISYGDGGWHAGRGGGNYYLYPSSGNALYPVALGAAGGSNYQFDGASGGGAIHLLIEKQFILHGILSADGMSCDTSVSSENASGGGAGGSIWLEVSPLGDFSGNGILSAVGGNGCRAGSGGGSGGRIAIAASADGQLSSFQGTIHLQGGTSVGWTRYLSGKVQYLPADGTLFITNALHEHGQLTTATKHSSTAYDPYTAVDISSSPCTYLTPYNYYEIDMIYVHNSDLSFSATNCQWKLTGGISDIHHWTMKRLFPSLATSTNNVLVRLQDAIWISIRPLLLQHIHMQVVNSVLYFAENITLQNDSSLLLSTMHSHVQHLSSNVMSTIDSVSNITMSLYTPIPFPVIQNLSIPVLTQVLARHIMLSNTSTLQYLPTTLIGWENQSNEITAETLYVSGDSAILANGILHHPVLSYLDNLPTTRVGYFGAASSTARPAASGGGHIGEGIGDQPGKSRLSLQTKQETVQNFFSPRGPGGPGGADMAKNTPGGNGGGALSLQINDTLVIHGLIDVSGMSGSPSTLAGGGAGGTILITTHQFQGYGLLLANGGNGSVSSTSMVHSGSGAGGIITINACFDSFQGIFLARGGITVQKLLLPRVFTSDLYAMTLGTVSAMDGLPVITNVNQYQQLQRIYTASDGVVIRLFPVNSPSIPPVFTGIICGRDSLPSDTITNMTIPSMSVSAYTLEDLVSENATLYQAILSTFGTTNVPPILSHPSIYTFPLLPNIHHLSISQLFLHRTHVLWTGQGSLYVQHMDISVSSESIVRFGGSVILYPTLPDFVLRNYSVTFTENSTLAPGNTLQLHHTATILLQNTVLTDTTNSSLLTIQSTIPPLIFSTITLHDSSRIQGSAVLISAENLYLYENSSITASGLGMAGGTGQGSSSDRTLLPTAGKGLGGGTVDEVGGNGGSYGGKGGWGLSTRYQFTTLDRYLGQTDLGISYLPVNTTGSGSTSENNITLHAYGTSALPVHVGSGGGGCMAAQCTGGAGGGLIVLQIAEDVYVDSGAGITADGQSVYQGGGGGSGGSIWIRPMMSGQVSGSGHISATGGHICPTTGTTSCTTSIDYPGGVGAGGRIRIDKPLVQFHGTVDVSSGCPNMSQTLLETSRMGSIVYPPATTTLVFNTTHLLPIADHVQLSDNHTHTWTNVSDTQSIPVLDIHLLSPPAYLVQVLDITGHARVQGEWTLLYGHRESTPLSAQATAEEVRNALTMLGYPETRKISVMRRPSIVPQYGWSWSITFHTGLDHVIPVEIDGMSLWCSVGYVNTNTKILSPLLSPPHNLMVFHQDTVMVYQDAPAVYTTQEVSVLLSFSDDTVLTIHSFGYWLTADTYRLVPNRYETMGNPVVAQRWRGWIGVLRLTKMFPLPTRNGWLESLQAPYLLDTQIPNWDYPSNQPSTQPTSQPSIPTSQPTGQPSGHPSTSPTGQPTNPTSGPSSVPSEIPSGIPSMQPVGCPSSVPSSVPTCPSSSPTSRPSHSRSPTAIPSEIPTETPSETPSETPTEEPTEEPSTMQPSTMIPSVVPSVVPSTVVPSEVPSAAPTTVMPTTGMPTTGMPTDESSAAPTVSLTGAPTEEPSFVPTEEPTEEPSAAPI